jgi:hypothetical protein
VLVMYRMKGKSEFQAEKLKVIECRSRVAGDVICRASKMESRGLIFITPH